MYYYLMKKTVIIYMFYLFFISNSFIIKKPRLFININDPKQFNEIKHITITPGGIGGLYSLGVSCFIKDNYDLKVNGQLCHLNGNQDAVKEFCKINIDKSLLNDLLSNSKLCSLYVMLE